MSTLRINDLFESRLTAWAEENSIKYTLANVTFTADDDLHLEPFIAPEPAVALGISQEVQTYSGSYQVNIVMKKGTGAKTGYQLAEEIISLFPGDWCWRTMLLTVMSTLVAISCRRLPKMNYIPCRSPSVIGPGINATIV